MFVGFSVCFYVFQYDAFSDVKVTKCIERIFTVLIIKYALVLIRKMKMFLLFFEEFDQRTMEELCEILKDNGFCFPKEKL